MVDNVTIEPMTEDFIIWRCLHRGPLTQERIGEGPDSHMAALKEIMAAYGTCAILARDGDRVMGTLRFYPKAICSSADDFAGLCLQGSPMGLKAFLDQKGLPARKEIEDETLTVHCMMTGSPFRKKNPYQRKGIGTRMVQELIRWGLREGWDAIEARAVEDLGVLYEHTGQAGKRFWEKVGFQAVATQRQERAGLPKAVLRMAREQASEQGLDPDVAVTWVMRKELGSQKRRRKPLK